MYVEAEWMRFGITEPEYERYTAYIERQSESLSRRFAASWEDEEDVRGEMWLCLLTLLHDRPPKMPQDARAREKYCRRAMRRAGLRCLERHLPDGPILDDGRVDLDRRTIPESELIQEL